MEDEPEYQLSDDWDVEEATGVAVDIIIDSTIEVFEDKAENGKILLDARDSFLAGNATPGMIARDLGKQYTKDILISARDKAIELGIREVFDDPVVIESALDIIFEVIMPLADGPFAVGTVLWQPEELGKILDALSHYSEGVAAYHNNDLPPKFDGTLENFQNAVKNGALDLSDFKDRVEKSSLGFNLQTAVQNAIENAPDAGRTEIDLSGGRTGGGLRPDGAGEPSESTHEGASDTSGGSRPDGGSATPRPGADPDVGASTPPPATGGTDTGGGGSDTDSAPDAGGSDPASGGTPAPGGPQDGDTGGDGDDSADLDLGWVPLEGSRSTVSSSYRRDEGPDDSKTEVSGTTWFWAGEGDPPSGGESGGASSEAGDAGDGASGGSGGGTAGDTGGSGGDSGSDSGGSTDGESSGDGDAGDADDTDGYTPADGGTLPQWTAEQVAQETAYREGQLVYPREDGGLPEMTEEELAAFIEQAIQDAMDRVSYPAPDQGGVDGSGEDVDGPAAPTAGDLLPPGFDEPEFQFDPIPPQDIPVVGGGPVGPDHGADQIA